MITKQLNSGTQATRRPIRRLRVWLVTHESSPTPGAHHRGVETAEPTLNSLANTVFGRILSALCVSVVRDSAGAKEQVVQNEANWAGRG